MTVDQYEAMVEQANEDRYLELQAMDIEEQAKEKARFDEMLDEYYSKQQEPKDGLTITPLSYAIHIKDRSPVFGDDVIKVTLEDEGAGSLFIIEQVNPSFEELGYSGMGKMTLEIDEARRLLEVIELLNKGNKDEQH